MAVGITHILTVLSIVQYALRVGEWTDVATQDLLRQREEEQRQQMTWLLEEMEQRSREPRGFALQGTLLAACQHWWFWASAETLLVLFFGLYWLPRQRSAGSDADSQQGRHSGVQVEENCQARPDPYDTPGQDQPLGETGASAARATRFPRTAF